LEPALLADYHILAKGMLLLAPQEKLIPLLSFQILSGIGGLAA
jgi:hypothetical protein